MKVGGWSFGILAIFFLIVGALYYIFSRDEIGTTALVMTGGLSILVAFYILYTDKRLDGLPEDRLERRELLRLLSSSDTWVPTHCPETGRDLDGIDIIAHAQKVFPLNVPLRDMSVQALEREAALYRAAGAKPPVRR